MKDLKGFGYFESDYSHGYVQATFRFNKLALEVIRFQLDLRGLNRRNTREISIIEESMKLIKFQDHTPRTDIVILELPKDSYTYRKAKKNIMLTIVRTVFMNTLI